MKSAQTLALLIPAYNAENYLPRLLASVEAQDGIFDEILIYDDCSTDRTADVAQQLGATVIQGDRNRGCTAAKNVLVNKTTCDWFHLHDADDLLLPGMIKAARGWMQTAADVVVFGCEERWADTNELIGVAIPDDVLITQDPIRFNIGYKVNSQSGLYRKTAFIEAGGFDLDPLVHYNEDHALHLKLARAHLKFRADPNVYSLYYKSPSSMSNANPAKCLNAHLHVMIKAASHESGPQNYDLISERFWNIAAGAAAQLDWQTARTAIRHAQMTSVSTDRPKSAFEALCTLSPNLAILLREFGIRLLRPKLRVGFPRFQINSAKLWR